MASAAEAGTRPRTLYGARGGKGLIPHLGAVEHARGLVGEYLFGRVDLHPPVSYTHLRAHETEADL
eukprot:2540424-Rhodomonas_salina.1